MKKVFALLLTAAMVLSLTACRIVIDGEEGASSVAKVDGSIGLAVSTQNNPFFVTLVEGAKGAAAKLGVSLQVTDAVEAVRTGRMGGTIAQQPDLLGATAVENAVTLINGGSIEKTIPVEVTLITAENAG